MQCLQAQQLISDALDRVAVEAADLELAKKHCRSCPECGRFVTAQLAVKRSLVVTPPDGLTDRVMGAVRTEAAEAARLASQPIDADVAAAVAVSDFEAANAHARLDRSRASARWGTWLAAAAGLIIVLGVGGVMTASMLSRSMGTREAKSYTLEAAPEQMTTGAAAEGGAADVAASAPAAVASGPAFITVGDIVYSFSGDSAVARASLTSVGSTSSSLDAASASPITLTILAMQGDPSVVYVEYQQRMLQFDRVTRDFEGKTYVLRSGTISGFGSWPTLPASITQPTSADGSPSLQSTDASSGATVFVRVGSTSAEGIAFPPGAAGPAAVSGAPVWTWWTPL